MTDNTIKSNGVHYTPPELASFLSGSVLDHLDRKDDEIRVLDPACGDGALLQAVVEDAPLEVRMRLRIVGYETDGQAAAAARERLADSNTLSTTINNRDFLDCEGIDQDPFSGQRGLFDFEDTNDGYDAVISNPPYVRTQILGAKRSRELADRFSLRGRVDLYQVFVRCMTNVLVPGGVLALLTSNRFMSIRAGESIRKLLSEQYELCAVYDLGDTKLFSAAVLPAIVVGRKRRLGPPNECPFARVYSKDEGECHGTPTRFESIVDAVRCDETQGLVATTAGEFHVERGILSAKRDPRDVWALSTNDSVRWIRHVERHQHCTFADVVKTRVGLKTTADEVFVRSDWECLPPECRPESALLRTLFTHHEARRWRAGPREQNRRVLYPHQTENGKRVAIRLSDFPKARAYFEAHAERLKRRKYIIESGRQWFELWVPHQPDAWVEPKVVFPDISVEPRFLLDTSGALVQGDCYWMTLKEGLAVEWLYLVLGVANSEFAKKFYDVSFHNKLYSGRRRFMTQYVDLFPLPTLHSPESLEIVDLVRLLCAGEGGAKSEQRVDDLVERAFGLGEESFGKRDL